MKKLLLLLSLVFVFWHVAAQKIILYEAVTDHSIRIIGDNFKGVIFTTAFNGSIPILDSIDLVRKFTPDEGDILLAETILNKKIRKAVRGLRDKINREIYKKLPNYTRQYAGFTNAKGQKIIYLNCFLLKDGGGTVVTTEGKAFNLLSNQAWYDHFIWSNHQETPGWQAEINLDENSIHELSVNSNF